MLLAQPKGDFHREADNIHNEWFEVMCQERVQYYDHRAKHHKHPSSGANRPSDIAVTVNINAECNLGLI